MEEHPVYLLMEIKIKMQIILERVMCHKYFLLIKLEDHVFFGNISPNVKQGVC